MEVAYSTPFDQNHQSVDPTGAQCARAQAGPVWFISGSEKVGIEKTCTLPKGKAILVPFVLINKIIVVT